ncbi:hypothetical protein BB170200_05456 [Mycobacterium marinum]|nr:hypothetical protein BB170200_05456 [Mycobacterium marinum]
MPLDGHVGVGNKVHDTAIFRIREYFIDDIVGILVADLRHRFLLEKMCDF